MDEGKGAERSPAISEMKHLMSWVEGLSERAGAVLAVAVLMIVAVGTVLAVREGSRLKSLDETAFLDLSQNIAFRWQFAHTNRPDIEGYDPDMALGTLRPTAYRAPGYAYLQASFRRLGAGYVGLRIVNFVLVGLTLCIMYSLLVRRGSRLAGLLGVALVLGYPVLFYAAGTLYPQTFAAFLLMSSVSLLDRLERKSTLRAYALAGVANGLLTLTIPVYLLLTPIVIGWLARSRRSSAKQIAMTTAAIGVVVGVWTLRNLAVFHAPVVLGTNSGFNLLVGNSPDSRYDQASAEVRWPKGVRPELIGKNEVERDHIMVRAALNVVRENPGHAAILYLKKLLHWFAFRNEVVSDRLVPGGAGAGPRWLRDLIMIFTYGLLIGILLLRFVLVRRYPFSRLEVRLLALYVGGGMAYAVYFTRIRFRLPFDWLLIALDALFLAQLLEPELRRPAEAIRGGMPVSADSAAPSLYSCAPATVPSTIGMMP